MITRFILSITMLLLLLFLTSARADNKKIEAETGSRISCQVVNDSKYSGGKAIRMTEEAAKLTLTLNISKRQKHKIYVAADGIGGQKDIKISINGASTIFKANTYAEQQIGTFILNEGDNTVIISPSWTWFNIDYVRIESKLHDTNNLHPGIFVVNGI